LQQNSNDDTYVFEVGQHDRTNINIAVHRGEQEIKDGGLYSKALPVKGRHL